MPGRFAAPLRGRRGISLFLPVVGLACADSAVPSEFSGVLPCRISAVWRASQLCSVFGFFGAAAFQLRDAIADIQYTQLNI